MNTMTIFTVLMTLTLCLVGVAVAFADDANMGTWKLNEAKSQFGPGTPKNYTVVYEAAGDNVRVTVDGTDGEGKPTHSEGVGKFDGKDYPVTGDPNSDMRSYTKIDPRTLGLNVKKGGKVTISGSIAVSPDGKIRTVTKSGTDAKRKEGHSRAVYEKQAAISSDEGCMAMDWKNCRISKNM